MKKQTLRSLYRLGVFTTISSLRANENGYAYVTLLGKNEKGETTSQNVYFGKTTSEKLFANYQIGDDVFKELVSGEVIEAKNAKGETRYKISIPANTAYSSAALLEEAWGEVEVDFNIDNFVSGFSARETVADNSKKPPVSEPAKLGG